MLARSTRYSIVVPAYNAAGQIPACLAALCEQSVPREQYEIVVVDDGSTDATADLARRWATRVIRQPHRGPAAARNAGARLAVGDYLLFTDADCVPAKTWIEEITAPLDAHAQVGGVKGTYRTSQRSLIALASQAELEVKYAALRTSKTIDFIDTGSAAFRHDAFWEVGGFDPSFPLASNEDTMLSYSMVAHGWQLAFVDRASVHHQHPTTLWRYLRRKHRHGFWRTRVYRRYPAKLRGDSYTPRSTQLQFITALLILGSVPLPATRRVAVAAAALFGVSTLPFVRQGYRLGPKVAAIMPGLLYLRALALALGLAQGAAALVVERSRARRSERSRVG